MPKDHHAKVEKHLKKLREKELELFTQYYDHPAKLFFRNFLMGTAKGLGFFVGAALVITLLAWILSHFLVNVPFIGDFFEAAASWLEANQPVGS